MMDCVITTQNLTNGRCCCKRGKGKLSGESVPIMSDVTHIGGQMQVENQSFNQVFIITTL
jgi:hypothetical protein